MLGGLSHFLFSFGDFEDIARRSVGKKKVKVRSTPLEDQILLELQEGKEAKTKEELA